MRYASATTVGMVAASALLQACGGGGGGGFSDPDTVVTARMALPEMENEGAQGLFIVRDASGNMTGAMAGAGALFHAELNANGSLTVDVVGDDVSTYADVAYQDGNPPYAHYARLDSSNGRSFDMYFMGEASNLQYTEYGLWTVSFFPFYGEDAIAMGFEGGNGTLTPAASMPQSGSATYNGDMIGRAYDVQNQATYLLIGRSSLTADFAGQTVNGSLSAISARNVATGGVSSFNDITLNGTISGNAFSGTAAVSSVPASPAALAAGASGTTAGHFYGPAANEAAGTWLLQDGSNKWAVGAFGGKR